MLTLTRLGSAALNGNTPLGQASGADVLTCTEQTGMPPDVCKRLLYVECPKLGDIAVGGTSIPLCYAYVRPFLVGLASEGCQRYVENQVGIDQVPSAVKSETTDRVITPVCDWIGKWVVAGMETYFTWGGPTRRALWAKFDEGLFWRACPSPDVLGPGEHWLPEGYGLPARCVLNVAVLDKENESRKVVYIPCQNIHADYLQQYEGAVCKDRDGTQRALASKLPGYYPGHYTKRVSVWPQAFEDRPWVSPQELRTQLLSTQPKMRTAAPSALPPRAYPEGTITAYDTDRRLWRIAVPQGTMNSVLDGSNPAIPRWLGWAVIGLTALATAGLSYKYIRKHRKET